MNDEEIVRQGIAAVFTRLGPDRAIKFFQSIGIQRGDTLAEIESITRNLTREEALKLVRKANSS